MESDFNTLSTEIDSTADRIEIGSSKRFRYYKTRRNGVLHFMKSLTPEFAADLISLEALRKEFILGYGLNHPNIVRYYSLLDNCIYEEYIDGETLKDLIDNKDRRLQQPGFLQNVCSQILNALRYLHNKGILHLDLKPENIMVSNLGNQIKIIDLSCAASAECDSSPGFTSEYMAPEQTFGKLDITTDIFQVGKVMGCLTETAGQNKVWKQFIRKATANHPDNRFKTAEDAINAIPFPRKNHQKWIIAIVSGLIFCGILSVVISNPKGYEEVEESDEQSTIETPEPNLPEIQNQETSVPEETSIKPHQNSKITLPSIHSERESERVISKKIERKLDALFSVKVTPMFNRMMTDESYRNSNHRTQELIDTYSKELDNMMAYGEELKAEYPDKTYFIDELIIKTFESRTSAMLLKLTSNKKEKSNIEENSQALQIEN